MLARMATTETPETKPNLQPTAHPHQLLTSGQRPRLFGCRRDLIRVTSGICTMPTIRNWQPTKLTAPRQRLIHTNPHFAACAISTAQDYHPNAWSNSSSGIGSASIPASCTTQSCPASAARYAAWSNSSSDELINDNTAQRRVESVNKERQQNLGARGQGANSFKVGIPVPDGV